MKHQISLILITLCLTFCGWDQKINAQVLKPAKWTFELSKSNARVGEEIDLIFKADIDEPWYMYATDFDPDCGPLLTEVIFEGVSGFEAVGKLKGINSVKKYDSIFGCDVRVFKKHAEFRQRIKLLTSSPKISG